MASIQDGLSAVQSALATWATAQLGSKDRLWFPGEVFSRPTADVSSPTATSWARLTVPGSVHDRFGIASSPHRRDIVTGILQIFTPKGAAQSTITGLAETARSALEALNTNPWAADIGWRWIASDDATDPWMQINLEFTYQHQYTEAVA